MYTVESNGDAYKQGVINYKTGMTPIETYTENDEYVVRVEAAGLDPDKDIEVLAEDGSLSIKLDRSSPTPVDGRSYKIREIKYGKFSRTVSLPKGSDTANVTASYVNGVLEVKVPLTAPKKISILKQIEVKS
jgi:HSP20 family molecular chaperone IbpA